MSDMLRRLKRIIDRAFFRLARVVFSVGKSHSETLLIVRTDGIGDLVFFLPYAARIRKHFSHLKCVLVCRVDAVPLADPNLFDAVIPFRYLGYRWNYLYRLRILFRIRRHKPLLAVYTSYHRQHIGDEMTILSGAQRSIAFNGNDEIIHPTMRQKNDAYFSEIIDAGDHTPEAEKYRTMLKNLGVGSDPVDWSLRDKGRDQKNDGYTILSPGGSAEIRRWPLEKFVKLGDALADRFKMKIVLCGGEAESVLLWRIAERMKVRPEVVTRSHLKEVAGLIRNAALFVGNESGLLHIAASAGTPAVGILGGGHFSRYFPYGSATIVNHSLDCYECNWHCPFPEPYCLTKIEVNDVVRVVEEVVSKGIQKSR